MTLRMVGYDWVLSIEHKDGMMSMKEALTKVLQSRSDPSRQREARRLKIWTSGNI